jgi:very-short-patch-repair endonuclease
MRNRLTQQRARSLRSKTTDAERHLWRYLKYRQLAGFRFRRQVPIGIYIADFACLEAKLVIELDGGQHRLQQTYDGKRDSALAALGFRVLRFWDNQALQATEAVLELILKELTATDSLLPPP